jgi:hypothetical protein
MYKKHALIRFPYSAARIIFYVIQVNNKSVITIPDLINFDNTILKHQQSTIITEIRKMASITKIVNRMNFAQRMFSTSSTRMSGHTLRPGT